MAAAGNCHLAPARPSEKTCFGWPPWPIFGLVIELTHTQVAAVLSALNAPAALESFLQVSPAGSSARRQWLRHEYEPCDTSGFELRVDHLQWFSELARSAQLHPIVQASDFFYISGARSGAGQPLLELEGSSLAAFRVLNHVFSFSGGRWQERLWLGSRCDPLLCLPYSRKYDRERAQSAEHGERRLWEQLERAYDLLQLLSERVEQLELGPESEFAWPPKADILDALAEDELGLGGGGLLAPANCLELVRLELTPFNEPQPLYPALAEGSYQGALAEVRHASAATQKKIALGTLQALGEAINALTHPHDEDDLAMNEERRATLEAAYVAAGVYR